MTKLTASALANTQRTVQSYEGFAREYDTLVNARRPPHIEDALQRLVQCLPLGGSVLEIGSGTGRDADFVESLGAVVRRTDATQAFLDLMAERGKKAELLNVMTDELGGGPYDGVLAMGVLIHVDREQVDPVLRKIHAALKPGGAFLVAMRKGEGETSGEYHTVQWTGERFAALLAAAGLSVAWRTEWVGRDGNEWVTFLARRVPQDRTAHMPLPTPTLRTARLLLRPFTEADTDAMFVLHSSPRVLRYWDAPPWRERVRAERFIAACGQIEQEGTGARLAIERAADGVFIGWCCLVKWNPDYRSATMGYCFDDAVWGQGFATEAAGALLQWAFGTLDLNRVQAETDTRNTASSRVLEKLRFVREGTLREDCIVDGEVSDSWVYGLLRREWEQLHSPPPAG